MEVIGGNLPSRQLAIRNFLYDHFRVPCYISILLLIVFFIIAYIDYVKHYYSLEMNKASFEDMINPNTEVGKAIANGTLQNAILKLSKLV